jgi:hypothetical protein
MKDRLLSDLEADADTSFDAGRWNNLVDINLTWINVGFSVLAAGLAAAELKSNWHWVTVIAAALPAAITSVQSRLRIQDLSSWYFRYSAALRGLAREIRYSSSIDIDEILKRRAKVDEDFERLWLDLKTRPGQAGRS